MNEFNELVAKATLIGYWSYGIAVGTLPFLGGLTATALVAEKRRWHNKTYNTICIILFMIGILIILMGSAGTFFAWFLLR